MDESKGSLQGSKLVGTLQPSQFLCSLLIHRVKKAFLDPFLYLLNIYVNCDPKVVGKLHLPSYE